MKNFLLIGLTVASCTHSSSPKSWTKEQWDQLPVRQLSFWKKIRPKGDQIIDKVQTPPPELLTYINAMNERDGIPAGPKPSTLNKEQKKLVQNALAMVPENIQNAINKKLVGIFFFDDLGSSALTEALTKSNQGFLLFDKKVLDKSANDWCTWKESSPFKTGPIQIRCTIAKEKQNNSQSAFLYIFLHEAAHLINIGQPQMPFWIEGFEKPARINRSPFFRLSWHGQNRPHQLRIKDLPADHILQKIKYYRAASERLPNEDSLPAYQALAKSSLPTMYGVINPWDDFAESFVNYIHTEILKRPFEIRLLRDDKVLTRYRACWKSPRCQAKKIILQQILKTL